MLLPPGTEKHKNLSTSFTRFDQLLQQLAEGRFCGYIKLTFWEYEGVLVMDMGRMIEALSLEKGVTLTGESAVLRLMKRAEEPDGNIEAYDLSSEVALALAYAVESEVFQDEQELSNYSLAQIIDMVERESLTGYLDLQFSNNKGTGTVYYLDGIAAEAVVLSVSGKLVSGETVLQKFLEVSELIQPQVALYRVKSAAAILQDSSFLIPWQHQKYLSFWQEFMQYLSLLINDQFRRNRFYATFSKVSMELSDHYPFLSPGAGDIGFSQGRFFVQRILHHATFIQGMVLVINKVLQQLPPWRARKLDYRKILADVQALATQNEVQPEQLDPGKLVGQVLRGISG